MASVHVMALMVVTVVALPKALALSCTSPFKAVDKWCVFANISVPSVAHRWSAAREACQKENADLVVLDDHGKLRAITKYIKDKYTNGGQSGYPFWVGGSKVSGEWVWVNGSPINLQSHLWIPDSPYNSSNDTEYIQLIQAGQWKRRYMESTITTELPGYICE